MFCRGESNGNAHRRALWLGSCLLSGSDIRTQLEKRRISDCKLGKMAKIVFVLVCVAFIQIGEYFFESNLILFDCL